MCRSEVRVFVDGFVLIKSSFLDNGFRVKEVICDCWFLLIKGMVIFIKRLFGCGGYF